MKRKDHKMKKYVLFIFLFLCLAVFFVLLFFWHKEKARGNVYEQLAEEYRVTEETKETDANVTEPESETAKPVEIPIDFAGLQEENPDIYAWIRIPDTVVDYPVLQSSTDDSYYLNHTVDHQEGFPGSIYTESLNKKDFSDANTVIYGHKMRNHTMFSDLEMYTDITYLKEHSEILIYTPDHIRTYRVFAAVTYDNRHIMHSFDFSDQEQYQLYLDSLKSVRNMATCWDDSVEVTVEDRIITLSTCNGNDAQRLLVEAVLVDEQ